jgi:ketosteroid isomerase-like protein
MRVRHAVIAALVTQGACAAVVVDVSQRHPTPRLLAPRPVETLKTYQVRPDGGVAVYGLQATGEELAEVDLAVKQKAASLGCDGVMVAVREDQKKSIGEALTGKLNEHHEYVSAHIDALCMVMPVTPDCPVAGASAGGATVADIEGTVRGVLEQWRQAYEAGSGDALAQLYAHDAGLSVVEDGAPLVGWAVVEPALRDRLGRGAASRVRVADVQVRAAGATAIVAATVLRERGGAAETGALTLVLSAPDPSKASGWVIIAEHYSRRT